jgi:hypothetical protein
LKKTNTTCRADQNIFAVDYLLSQSHTKVKKSDSGFSIDSNGNGTHDAMITGSDEDGEWFGLSDNDV